MEEQKRKKLAGQDKDSLSEAKMRMQAKKINDLFMASH